MKVLVTGGSGNIGRSVVAELSSSGHEVTIFDVKGPEGPSVEFVLGSVTEAKAIERAAKGMDAIVHLAAIPALRPDVPGVEYMHVNVAGTFNVLEAAAKESVGKVVMASSDSTLGFVFCTHRFAPECFPIDEAHPLRPQDPYGLSKLLGEEVCKAATRKYGVQTVCLRFCWVWFEDTYAHRQDVLDGDINTLTKILWGYVDVRDAAQACRLAVESTDPTPHDAFFITAADTFADTPSLDLIRTHFPEVRTVSNAYLAGPYKGLIDTSKARKLLGYAPQYTWRDNQV